MKALRKQLTAAIAMVVVAVIALSSSTYAWFSMNNTVTATGMTVRATTDASLVIKGSEDSAYSATGTNALSALTMKPSTSYDGLNFGYLSSGNKVPSAASSTVTWTGGTFASADLTKATTAGTYYATTTYSLKSIAESKDVYVSEITVTSGNTTLKPAVRVSVTMGDTTKVFNAGGGTNASEGVGKLTGSTWTLDTPTYISVNTAGAKLGTLAADTPTDVTINIWFEGQDTACFSDNANADNFTLVISFTTIAP